MTDTPRGLMAWELLLRTQAALVPLFEARLKETSGLPLSWYDVLLELERAPDRQLRMSELGERVVLSRSRVSRIADQMDAAGLIVKEEDPSDGRATVARLTRRGHDAFGQAVPVYLAAIADEFSAHLDPDEIEGIIAGLGKVLGGETAGPATPAT